MNFSEVVEKFLLFQEQRLKWQTYLLMKRNFKLHINPFFENMKLEEIDYEVYLKFKNYVENKGYKSRFNNSLHSHMVCFFDFLNTFYGVQKNIPKLVGGFPIKKEIRNYKTWNVKTFKKFLKSVDNFVYKRFFNFIFFTGLRMGEVLGLQFKKLSNDYRYVNISEQLPKELKNGKRELQTTKTNKDRFIRLDIFTKISIYQLKKYYIKKYGYFDENFFIFGGKEPLARTTIKRKKDKWCEKANVPKIRIHDLRHSHATILYQKKVPIKVIQERLGHSSINTTMNIYVHVDEKQQKRVARTLLLTRFNIFM